MTITLPETDGSRTVVFEDVPHLPGSVFLTVRDPRSGAELSCVEVERAALVLALLEGFGLVDPLEDALRRS
jgi:hypothetical protein